MSDKKFGHWAVIGAGSNNKMLRCRCFCGITKEVNKYNLSSGKSTSCGCATKHDRARTHGLSSTPEYQIWKAMKARCYNPDHKSYKDYGGRGIRVCDEWINDFHAFYIHVGERPGKEYSIDRIDNNKNYEPGNCKWSTQKEQTNNTRRSKRIVFAGESRTILEVSEITGIKDTTIYHRLAAGCSDEEAVRAI